ncbi:MAG: FAD-binding protein [Treponema sp.]|nr:FAD-binding protein [Treponema sp.]
MIKSLSVTVLPNDEHNEKLIRSLLEKEVKKSGIHYKKMTSIFEKKSIDARRGQVKLHLRYRLYLDEEPPALRGADDVPEWKVADGKESVLIVGAGPAGLFGALKLLEYGVKPIIIERGADTAQRKKDIALISTQGLVNEDSNYCFGEGGAGTFSDGKLYTRSNKRGDISQILRIFAHFGADPKILTDAHPHIGTDRLPQVINNMRAKIIECGGEFYFNHRCTELIVKDGAVKGLVAINHGEEKKFYADAVLLATGHSAPDIYRMIARAAPSALEAKTFAAGVRVEHPRELIDSIQFHAKGAEKDLGAAEYRLTTQVDDRGVYSFCMCPGGFVVPSSSSPDEIVVNGMSAAKRNSRWSNAAIVVEIRPEDIPAEYKEMAEKEGCPALAGLFFRTAMEAEAKAHGKGQSAPAQRLTDFLANRPSESLPKSSYTAGLCPSNLNTWLAPHICSRLQKAFPAFNNLMRGYICEEALMIAIETRTSTPVRICRDKESLECPALKNLYPAGEGSGYAGGIVSSAMDGENSCKQIVQKNRAKINIR